LRFTGLICWNDLRFHNFNWSLQVFKVKNFSEIMISVLQSFYVLKKQVIEVSGFRNFWKQLFSRFKVSVFSDCQVSSFEVLRFWEIEVLRFLGTMISRFTRVWRFLGFKKLICNVNWYVNWYVFRNQRSRFSRYLGFEVSRFQDYKVSRYHGILLWRF
jgi:hypothetical protein